MLRKTPDWRSWCSSLVVGSVLISCLQAQVFAQISPDNTLLNNSSVARDGNIFNITGGTQAGSNLFHSFREFSVPPGGTASFNNAVDIQNIISRVTGGSFSNINGSIRASGKANLFLINPNGIIFGEGARLDIGGSFVGTTANAIGFGDRGFFSATNPNTPQLLTVNPSAFLFNQIAAQIQNNSIAYTGIDPAGFDAFGLRVPDGKSLLLVGGNVSMDGGRLNAYGGRVELAGLSEPGSVALDIDGDNLSLRFLENVTPADISLTYYAGVFVGAAGGGNIVVNARNIEIERSFLSAGIAGGNITLNASGTIKIAGGSIVRNLVRLVQLPTIPVDTKVAQGCYSQDYAQNRFVIAGRGGLPPNPQDILAPDTPQIDWVSVKPTHNNRSIPPLTTSKPTTSTPKRIIEATGATLNAKGQIVLSANSSAAPYTFRHNPIQCHGS